MSTKTVSFLVRLFGAALLFSFLLSPQGGVSIADAGTNVWSGSGPEGGTITRLAIDPKNANVLYAGTDHDGIFKSIDQGGTWTSANNGLDDLRVRALAVDPINSSTLYAGTFSGVFKTIDGGASWRDVNFGLSAYGYVPALAINPVKTDTLYAAMGDAGIFRSENGGNSWSEINYGLSEDAYIDILAIDPLDPDVLYATGWNGFFKSVDGGDSWTPTGIGFPRTWVKALAVDPLTPGTLHVGTREGHVFKSTDGGEHWHLLSIFPADVEIRTIVVDPKNPTIMYIGTWGNGIYRSMDGGGIWGVVGKGLSHIFIDTLVVDEAATATVYAGSTGGVYQSTDHGENWKAVNTGLPAVTVYTLATDPLTPATIYAGTSAGAYRSIDKGLNWTVITTGLTTPEVWTLAIDYQNPKILYAAGGWISTGTGVFKSTDAGENWYSINAGLSAYPIVDSLAIDPVTPSTLYARTRDGVFKSMNSGVTWAASNTGLPDPRRVYFGQGVLAIDPTTPSTLYVGIDGGIYKSTDSGGSWSPSSNGLSPDAYVHAIAIDPKTPARLYAGTDSGIFKSTDGGKNWWKLDVRINGWGSNYLDVRALAFDPSSPPTLYAAASPFGVIQSTDDGGAWNMLNNWYDLPNTLSLAFASSSSSILYAGTERGVYSYEMIKNLETYIGGELRGENYILPGWSERVSYPAVDNGPVKVMSTDGHPIIASERINLGANGAFESYAEVMGLPASKLSDTYVFPWYNNTGFLDSQLRFGNAGDSPTTVTIKINGVTRPETFHLGPNESARVSFAGVDNGPVEIKSSGGVPIIAALRINLKASSPFTSYCEFPGMSASSTAATRYLFPWYNNTGLLDSQLRIANIGSDRTTVTVTIGGWYLQETYTLDPSQSMRLSYPVDNGPVDVSSSNGVPITASMRINLETNPTYTSYTELLGLTGTTLTDTRYLFPWYNNTGLLDSQLRFANVGKAVTTVSIKINGIVQAQTYTLTPNQSTRVSLAGVDNGPVEVYSSDGVPIIAALRINMKANPSFDSYYEFLGSSVGSPLGLPGDQLSTTYWFPWYNNTGLLNSQLRFGMP